MNTGISHTLQFNVAQLLKQSGGARRAYEIDVPPEELEDVDEELRVVAPLRGSVRFLRVGRNILVKGRLETTLELGCIRCLEPFLCDVTLEIEDEEFFPELDVSTGRPLPVDPEADSANMINEQHILDLREVVRQDILLEVPISPVCRPDCRGICIHCGENLNTGTCDCQEEEQDPRWEALRSMMTETDPGSP